MTHPAYLDADCTQTLDEATREYHGSDPALVDGRGTSDAAREFFRCHDVAHVVFGCSTSLIDEAAVKIWSFCGTTAGLGLLRDYRLPESQEIYATLPRRDMPGVALRSTVIVPRVIARCMRMKKRWPWSDFEVHRATPLNALREEYGIRILSAP